MIQNQFTRYLHTSLAVWSSVSKSHLAKLRKKTGYTFSNCKKALEVNDNDLVKAEKWLQDQAEALGWSKLSKLEGRVTAQGLVGLAFEGKRAALVEINCETDFVARNKYFKEMVNTAASACLQNLKPSQTSEIISKEWFDSERLKTVKGPDSKKLADHVALLVSNVGENITLKRAVYIDANKDINLACYIHPDQGEKGNILNGKYAAVVAYTAPENNFTTEQIARQLCQHVIGMNPKRIKKEAEEEAAAKENETKQVDGEANNEEKEEDAMLSQDFLLDPSLTVEQVLTGSGITVHDFVRYETGEKIIVDEEPVVKVKASQLGR